MLHPGPPKVHGLLPSYPYPEDEPMASVVYTFFLANSQSSIFLLPGWQVPLKILNGFDSILSRVTSSGIGLESGIGGLRL